MPPQVQVWSDFVCPFCMIAEAPLQQALAEYGQPVSVRWMPFELRPAPSPTLRPEDPYLQSIWPQSVYPLADQFGVDLRLPSISPQPHTGLAWEGFQFAEAAGLGNDYNHAVLAAFFQHDRDIGSIEVLSDIAASVGLDADRFAAALRDRRHRDAHQRAFDEALDAGVTSVPTFRIGERWLRGVQPAERLLAALQAAQDGAALDRP